MWAAAVLLVGGLAAACAGASPASTLTGTSWVVASIAKEDVTGTVPTIEFGAGGALSGTTGCNRYSGTYETDGAKLTIGSVAATAMACADPVANAQEADFLAALSGAVSWEIDAKGDLEIRAPSAITDMKGTADIVAAPAGGALPAGGASPSASPS